jgi:hypothetical protein
MYNIEIKILRKLRNRIVGYCQEVCSTDHTDDTFNSLPTILVSQNDPSCICRCQYNEIYFRELFLAAHFSRKFEKPSDKRFRGFIFSLRMILSYHTFRNLPSKIVLYSIYVIMYARGNQLTRTTDHRPRTHFKSFLLPESPIIYDTRRTMFCLSFLSIDRATVPGQYEQSCRNVETLTKHVPYPQKIISRMQSDQTRSSNTIL